MMVSVNSRKGRISVNNTKNLLPFGILYLNTEVGGLSMRLKIKKRRKKKIKIKTTKAKNKKNKRLSPSWDSNHDRLRGKQGSYPLGCCIIWLLNRFVKYLCKFLYIVWETRS